MILKVLFILLILSISSLAFAEEVSKIYQLDEITVSEEKIREERETPNATVVIPELLLQGISSNLDGALFRQTGVDVQRIQEIGGALDDESIKIRGFGARRIILAFDGRILNTPGTAGGYFIDWTTIPLANIEKIFIIKGVSDPRYGNTLGGIINLIPKRPKEKPEIEAQVMKAKYDTDKLSFFHSWKPSRFEYSISGNYIKSDGYLRNGHFEVKNLNLYLGYNFPWDGKIKANFGYSWVKKGFIVNNRKSKDYDNPDYDEPVDENYPASDGEIMYGGMGAYPEDGSWWKRDRYNFDIGYEQALFSGILDIRVWKNYAEREAYNTRRAQNRIFHKKWFDDKSYGADGSFKITFDKHNITFGFDYVRFKDGGDKNYPDDFRAPFQNSNYVNSEIIGVYLMDDFHVTPSLIITPGLRYSSYEGKAGPAGKAEGIKDISMDGIAPSLKVTYNYDKNSLLYLSLARALRMPTPPEHYWHYSPDAGVYTGDLPFKKEDGLMIQGGWKAELPTKTYVEISPYYYRIKNFIHFDLINFVSYNIGRATLYGLEIEVSQQLGRGFSAFANYTFQKSKTKDDPFVENFVVPEDRDFDEIPALPKNKINLGIQYKGSRGEKFTLYGRYVSSQKVIYNNNTLFNTDLRVRTQKSYFTADFEVTYPLTKNFQILGYLHNIFDKDYQERFGYPAAGRNWGIGIRGIF
ncbi:MAG: TonB-dependent receptor [Thermodesulfovibrionaceae bacterium]